MLFVFVTRSFIFLFLLVLSDELEPVRGGPVEKQPHARAQQTISPEKEPEPDEPVEQKRFRLLLRRRPPSTTSGTPTARLLPLLARRVTPSTPATVLQQRNKKTQQEQERTQQGCKNKHECVPNEEKASDRGEAANAEEEGKDRKGATSASATSASAAREEGKGNGEPAPAGGTTNSIVRNRTYQTYF